MSGGDAFRAEAPPPAVILWLRFTWKHVPWFHVQHASEAPHGARLSR